MEGTKADTEHPRLISSFEQEPALLMWLVSV